MEKPFDEKMMLPLMKRNFKYQFPAYAEATEVDVIPGQCPVCEAEDFWCYSFLYKGEKLVIPAWKKCLKCGNKELSKIATDHAEEKRLNHLITNWYEATDDEKFGFKNYEVSNSVQLEARDKIRNYVQAICQNSLKDETNLLVQGSTGTGKTHLTKAAARTLKHRGLKVGFVTAHSLFHKFKSTFGKPDTEVLQKRLYGEMKTLDVLFIDDVGAEAVNWIKKQVGPLLHGQTL